MPRAAPYPFLKWAGGKSQILADLSALYPAGGVRRYIEPFLGGAAVFFDVRRRLDVDAVVLGDGNTELIDTYRAIRDALGAVIERLLGHERAHSRDHFYEVRAQEPFALPESNAPRGSST